MDQVALFTAILLMSILGQSANTDQHKNLVAEIPFNQGETQILREEQTRKLWEARNAVIEAQKNAPVERVIIEGYFTGQANADNTRRAVERAGATKRWLQTFGGLYRIAMDDRVGASGENKRVAKILIEGRAENEAGRTGESPRVLPDIVFSQNSSELRDYNLLWEAREEIRNNVQQKGPARLVIEGHAAQNETNPANRAENRATTVRPGNRSPISSCRKEGSAVKKTNPWSDSSSRESERKHPADPAIRNRRCCPPHQSAGDWFNASSPGTKSTPPRV